MQHNLKLLATILLSAITLSLSAVTLSGCHQHAHDSKFYPATCTEAGYHEDVCWRCGNVNLREETSPALGHSYDGGFCERCGQPDPNDTSLSDGSSSEINLSADGTLSWTKLKSATKYELTLTTPNSTEPVIYTFKQTQSTAKLDDLGGNDDYNNKILFPSGRTFAKFVHYELYTETIEGEKIEQEVPMTESADEFRIIKVNGVFELERMGYSDENLSLSGFYSTVKSDESGEYYLYEIALNEKNENAKVNLPRLVQLASGNKASYYKTEQDRTNSQNAISSFDWNYMNFPAGASTIFVRVTLAGGGFKDYNLRVYGLRNLEIIRYTVSGTTRSEFGSKIACREGDIIPCENLFYGLSSSSYSVRDSEYNYIGKADRNYSLSLHDNIYVGADYTVKYCGGGNGVELYFYDGKDIKSTCDEVKKVSETYFVNEVWSGNSLEGFNLSYRILLTATEAVIPSSISQMKILAVDFTYAQVNTITVESTYTLPALSLNVNVTTINLGDIYSISQGAFVGANSNLVINCAFGEDRTKGFEAKWNYKNPANQYSTEKYTVNYNNA